MKKVFVVLVVLFVVGSGAVFAQASGTADLVLSGVVGANVSISIEGNNNEALMLQSAQTNVLVGTATEIANVPYSVGVSSANDTFALTHSGGETIGYTLTYGGLTANATGGNIFTAQSATSGRERDIRISYAPEPSLPEGVYSDLITLTITAD